MKSKLLVLGVLALGSAAAFADNAVTAPPAPAAGQAPTSQPAPDPSRVQDAGPVHFVIQTVEIEGVNYVISGVLSSSEATPIRLSDNGGYTNGIASGATSPGGDPGLRCTRINLGDSPEHNYPVISVIPGRGYKFSLTIQTHDGSRDGLQEFRIGMATQEGAQVVSFPNLLPDAPGQVAAPAVVASADAWGGSRA